MFFLNNQRHKPVYKKFLLLRKNVQNKKKLFKFYKFKKQKWHKFFSYLKKNFRWKRKKPYTIYNFYVPKFISYGNKFKKKFRNDLHDKQRFSLFYSGLKKKGLKNQINQIYNKNSRNFNLVLLEMFESRLDSILYRAHFSHSIRNSQQLISHGCVKVNNTVIRKKSYLLKKGDIIEIKPEYSGLVKKTLKTLKKLKVQFWVENKLKKTKFKVWFWRMPPIPPSYLIIKYKTLQIVVGEIKYFNFSNSFSFWLNTNSILTNYHKHLK